MKKKLLFLFFISLLHFSSASANKTNFKSDENYNNASKDFEQQVPKIKKDIIFTQTEVKHQKNNSELETKKNKKKPLSKEEKKRNFFMRTGLQILGTFVFIFVLYLVFRMKKK